MRTFYLDTTAAVWMDENGNLFSDNTPAFTIGSTQNIAVILVTASPDRGTTAADPSAWPRDTSWTTSEAGQTVTGMLTIDNDYLHRNRGQFVTEPQPGDATIVATFGSLANYELAAAGVLTLIEPDATTKAVGYNAFSFDAATGQYTFTLDGTVPASDAGGFVACAVPQPPLCQAFADPNATDLASGVIGFTLTADSGRLRELTEYTSTAGVGVNGLELLMYRQTSADSVVEPIRAFTLVTATLQNPMGDPGYEAEPPEPVRNMIAAAVEEAMRDVSPLMRYVTDSTTTNATLNIAGGTHLEFTQPLQGLTFASVQSSHDESEIIFTAGTAFPTGENHDPKLPVNASVIGELNIEAGKKYVLNIRDAAFICGEFTVVGMDFSRGIWYWDDAQQLDTSEYHGQTSLGSITLNGGTLLINAGSTVSSILVDSDSIINTEGTVSQIQCTMTYGSINISAGTVGNIQVSAGESVKVSGTALVATVTATNDSDQGAAGADVTVTGGTVARLVMKQTSESEFPMSLTISGGTVGLALVTQTGIANGTVNATISPAAVVVNLED